MTRRVIITFIMVLLVVKVFCQTTSPIQNIPVDTGKIILSVNAYSFNDLLMAREKRDNQQVYTLFNLIDWCASQNIKALDPTAYFFPTYPEVPSDEYLKKFKDHAAANGVAISGTGIRNNFASSDPKIRAVGIELAKNWIIAASKIGAPVLRVFAGAIPEGYENNWDIPAQWLIESYKELLPYAKKYGVKIVFFHKVTDLKLSEDRKSVSQIILQRQVSLKPALKRAGYQPTFKVARISDDADRP